MGQQINREGLPILGFGSFMRKSMSHMISLRPTPSKYICQELLKEFSINRFCLNHYEFVDFTIFEYGQRAQYLQWRVFSVLLTFLLTAHIYFPAIDEYPGATIYSRFIYMHSWLGLLSIIHSILEVISLTWIYFCTASPMLVRIHQTPWHFKILWLMYNTIYPNIMSCNVMYYMFVKSTELTLGESKLFIALMASFAGIHVSVTAIPSRINHIIHPLLFNIFHIVATIVYQFCAFTDPGGHNYVYKEMDWLNSRRSAIIVALTWLLITSCCHILMVWCCWVRRLVYRGKRKRSTTPIYGFSPEEYYPFSEESVSSDHFEIPFDKKEPPSDATADALIEDPPVKNTLKYSPHMSYRQLGKSPLKESSVDVYLDCSDSFSCHSEAHIQLPAAATKEKHVSFSRTMYKKKRTVKKSTKRKVKRSVLKPSRKHKSKSSNSKLYQVQDFAIASPTEEISEGINIQASSPTSEHKLQLYLHNKVRSELSHSPSMVYISDVNKYSIEESNMIHWKPTSTEVGVVENAEMSQFTVDHNEAAS